MTEPHCDNSGRCVPDDLGSGCQYCGKELARGPDAGCFFTWDHADHEAPMCQTHDSTECTPPGE